MIGMKWMTPEWRDEYTQLAKGLEQDLKAEKEGQRITYASYSEFMKELHGKTA